MTNQFLVDAKKNPLPYRILSDIWSLDISKDGFRAEAKVLARNLVDAAEVHAGKPQLDLSKASAVECILSRRDSMIVARHEVPGKASLKRTVP